jgi:hypothetical protein
MSGIQQPGVVSVVAALIALTGCGGSTPNTNNKLPEQPLNTRTAAPKPTLSQAGLIAQMNAICKEGNARIAIVQRNASGAYLRALDAELHIYHVFIPKLEALRPPPEARSAFDRYLQALNRQRGLTVRFASALRSGESEEAIEGLKNSISTNSKTRVLAAIDLGAERCGTP